MDARTFLDKHGKDVATKVAARAGTNWAYFSQIAYGHRRPSPELAIALVDASAEEVSEPEERLDFEGLLVPKKRPAAEAAA